MDRLVSRRTFIILGAILILVFGVTIYLFINLINNQQNEIKRLDKLVDDKDARILDLEDQLSNEMIEKFNARAEYIDLTERITKYIQQSNVHLPESIFCSSYSLGNSTNTICH